MRGSGGGGGSETLPPSLLSSGPSQLKGWGCGGEEVGALAQWPHATLGVTVPDLGDHGADEG